MYRRTKRYERQRNEKSPALGTAAAQASPKLRRKIIIIDYDLGRRVSVMDLYRTNRVDCYNAVANGQPWKQNIGWSRVLEWIRKSHPRMLSTRALQ